MGFELSLKNKRVRIWLCLMVPAFILAIALFIFLPNELSIAGTLPLIIGYFFYLGWIMVKKKQE
ncbi:hypothetical protein KO561_03930 [Radiobacillus kanasensis]|uniref:hypothetical protein n=1 Tax=Radiobacillus kanasensis TaxID=2844358 RepID=UPI001E2C6358|nr:hypothetical protein [Radiobacillus kanasensis]UFU00123.1 hypothetical protein KO561_03930 [Radiobacillus kanasensis]